MLPDSSEQITARAADSLGFGACPEDEQLWESEAEAHGAYYGATSPGSGPLFRMGLRRDEAEEAALSSPWKGTVPDGAGGWWGGGTRDASGTEGGGVEHSVGVG